MTEHKSFDLVNLDNLDEHIEDNLARNDTQVSLQCFNVSGQTLEELNKTIDSMLEKDFNVWKCTQCGKTERNKGNMQKHVEAKHIDGAVHPCQTCGKQFRTGNSLNIHTLRFHKQ